MDLDLDPEATRRPHTRSLETQSRWTSLLRVGNHGDLVGVNVQGGVEVQVQVKLNVVSGIGTKLRF
jgi:hypothetical protein